MQFLAFFLAFWPASEAYQEKGLCHKIQSFRRYRKIVLPILSKLHCNTDTDTSIGWNGCLTNTDTYTNTNAFKSLKIRVSTPCCSISTPKTVKLCHTWVLRII